MLDHAVGLYGELDEVAIGPREQAHPFDRPFSPSVYVFFLSASKAERLRIPRMHDGGCAGDLSSKAISKS